jgi:hypothetical protein
MQDGKTAFDLAKKNFKDDIVQMIEVLFANTFIFLSGEVIFLHIKMSSFFV